MKKFSEASFFILLFLFSFKNSKSQDIEELLQPKCDGKTIKYSILINLLEYLQNENTENKEIYYSAEDLKSKRIGRYLDTYMGDISLDLVKTYKEGESFQTDLIRHKVDAVLLYNGFSKTTQMFTNELSIFPEPFLKVELAFGLQKDNLELKQQLNNFIDKNVGLHESLLTIWDYANTEGGYLNTELKGDKGILNILGKSRYASYIYLRDKDKVVIFFEFPSYFKH